MNITCDACRVDYDAFIDGAYASEYLTLCPACARAHRAKVAR